MEILVAKKGGFCHGVKRAVDTAMTIAPNNTYIYGEIIHNKDVVDEITKRGIITVNDLSEVPDGKTLIIRSHGVAKKVFEECKKRNIKVVDCTCEFVRRTQKIVNKQYDEGKTIVIVGEKTHPEVIGINGWCNNSAYVFSSENDDFSVLSGKNCCVVAQTTYSKEKFEKIIKNIKNINNNDRKTVEVFETICYTTIGRQIEAEKLSSECDAMLVVGGINSSNTNKLYDICKKNCDNVFRMRNSDDLDYSLIKRFKKVGIVTGASTPNAQTQEVLLKMEMENKEANVVTEGVATNDNPMNQVIENMDNQNQKFKKGQLIKATISLAKDEGIEVSLPQASITTVSGEITLPQTKKEILLAKEEIDCEEYNKDDYVTGDEIELMVVSNNPLKLSQKKIKELKEEAEKIAAIEAGEEFTIECTGCNKGGLTGSFGSYAVFVPAKEIRMGYVKDLEKYKGKKLRLKKIEIKTERRKEIIASQRLIIAAEKEAREAAKAAKEAEFFANIHEDDIVEGKVERVTNFGAFVSVNGFDCLAHISDLSWTGVKSVTDVLEIGKKYEFKVLKVDAENKKVSIGYKQLQAQPWELAADKYAEGDVIHGKVVRIVAFGAFIEVEKGIDGLVPISQMSYEFIENPTTILAIGDEIDAKILKLDCAEKKMTLSMKALEPKPENVERKPRASRNDADGESRPRKARKERPAETEFTDWSEDDIGGASIADMLRNN